MSTFGAVRDKTPPPRRVSLRQEPAEYSIELDVSDFARRELQVEIVGKQVTVRCDHDRSESESLPLPLHEQLEETFRLPDDADLEHLRATYRDGMLVLSAKRRPLARRFVPVEVDYLVDSTPKGC